MLNKERQTEILKYLSIYETASVSKLTKMFFASEATIRRDLTELEHDGQIKRIYGGATIVIDGDKQIPLYTREREYNDEKKIICEKANSFIKDGQVIYIDGSSTSQLLAKSFFKYKDLVVITNGLKIAQILGDMHIKVYCTGGFLIDNSYVFTGPDAESFIEKHNADICFISCKGLSNDGLLSDTSESETIIRKKMLKNSKTKIMLITSNKIGKTFIHTLCKSTDVNYILSDIQLPSSIHTKESI